MQKDTYAIIGQSKLTYINHMRMNLYIVKKSIKDKMYLMAFFHLVHALIPCKLTEHEFWGLK